jgi:tetratricopeptide (TPR) repeat protein
MKSITGGSPLGRGLRNEKGSAAYSFFGFALIVVVIVVAIFYLPGMMKSKPSSGLASAATAMANGDYEKAVSIFDKAIKAQPDNIKAYVGRSAAYLNMGDLDKSLADANDAVKLNPKSALAFGQKAIVEKMLGQNEDAIKDLTKAIELDSGYTWALAQRADLYSKQDDQEKALADATAALKNAPKFADGYRVRGWILSRMGKCKAAAVDFQKVAELKPDDAGSIQDRAWFLMTCPDESLRDDTKALELARKASDLTSGKDAVVQESLAEAYFRQGDPAKAAEVQKEAIALKSKSCPSGSCAEEMKKRLEKYELAARNEVRKSYEILPTDSTYKP